MEEASRLGQQKDPYMQQMMIQWSAAAERNVLQLGQRSSWLADGNGH